MVCYFNTLWCYVQTLGCNFNTCGCGPLLTPTGVILTPQVLQCIDDGEVEEDFEYVDKNYDGDYHDIYNHKWYS